MPRDGANVSPDAPEPVADLLARAARARQHARFFVDDPVGKQLEQFADELEARARRIGKPRTVADTGTSDPPIRLNGRLMTEID
ncbi:MAG TPA: hypothetical protein VNW90_23500 [Acetobacteraceae bacterium]|nr:hypothetical protein [Acetobacteraceae bacterium]